MLILKNPFIQTSKTIGFSIYREKHDKMKRNKKKLNQKIEELNMKLFLLNDITDKQKQIKVPEKKK